MITPIAPIDPRAEIRMQRIFSYAHAFEIDESWADELVDYLSRKWIAFLQEEDATFREETLGFLGVAPSFILKADNRLFISKSEGYIIDFQFNGEGTASMFNRFSHLVNLPFYEVASNRDEDIEFAFFRYTDYISPVSDMDSYIRRFRELRGAVIEGRALRVVQPHYNNWHLMQEPVRESLTDGDKWELGSEDSFDFEIPLENLSPAPSTYFTRSGLLDYSHRSDISGEMTFTVVGVTAQ